MAFLDFVDASITNVALPRILTSLHFSVQSLQWVPSAYLLTYGGFMLLGGRLADLLGRRNVLLAGTILVGLSSLAGGFAGDAGVFIGARLAQGLGAALMLPAALSTLTTTFTAARDRQSALGVWAAVAGLSSAAGILLGGVLTEGPGWRWVMFVNPIACVLVIPAVLALLPHDRPTAQTSRFDLLGSAVVTGGMLLLVYALVKAPDEGWGSAHTIGELATALAVLAAFAVNELRSRDPLFPFSILRIKGLAAADATQLIAFAGFVSLFFFLTLYMQNVLGFSPIRAGAAYLPVTVGIAAAAGVSSRLFARTGTRPVIVVGSLIAAGGMYYLSRIPVHGSYLTDLLPGLLVMSAGLGAVFVAVTTAANAGVPADKAGLAAGLLNTSLQLGSALGLAIFSAIATARTHALLAARTPPAAALTAGFHQALLACSIFLLAAALIAVRAANTRGETSDRIPGPVLAPDAP